MGFELVGSRLLAPSFGNSIYVWGSLIGVFLGALSVGYAAGGRIADRWPSERALAVVLSLATVLVAGVVLFSQPLQSLVVQINPGIRMNPLVASILIFGPASVLMGMVSPYAVRLSAERISTVGSTAGNLYGVSTAGSIAGTIGTAFWLIGSVGSETAVLLLSGVLGVCAVIAAFASLPPRGMVLGAAFVAAAVPAAMYLVGAGAGAEDLGRTGQWSPVLRAGGYEEPVELDSSGKQQHRKDSSYHRIRVVDYEPGTIGTDSARVLHFDKSLQAASSLDSAGKPDPDAAPLFAYLRAYDLLPAMRPDAERALLIGLGSGALAMRLHQLHPDLKIDVVEIDPAVVDVAREWFAYDDAGDTIETHVGDGRSWLAATDTKYDLIVVDAFFADSVPFHLTTREFVDVVRDHLTDDGVAAANLIGAVEGGRSKLFRSMLRTWGRAFDEQVIYPIPRADGQVALNQFANVEVFLSDEPLPAAGEEQEALTRASLPVDVTDSVLDGILEARYEDDVSTDGVPTLTDDFAPVDSLVSLYD
jgi:hypothetical protein